MRFLLHTGLFGQQVKVAQSCLTLCDPMDYTVYRILQARILELSSLSFLQGIFPKQGSNPGLPHCRWIPAEPQGKPLVSKKSCTGLGSGRPAGQSLQQCLDGTEPGHPLLQPTTPPFNLFSSHKLENHLLCSSLSLGPVNTFFFFFFFGFAGSLLLPAGFL